MKYKVYMNAGVEWWTELEADNQEDAEEKANSLCLAKLGDLRDYNFDIEVTPHTLTREVNRN